MSFLRVWFPNQAERVRCWPATQKRGIARFILVQGVLGAGVPMEIIGALTSWAMPPHIRPTVSSVIITAPLWVLGGACIGWMMWSFRKAEFRAAQLRAEGLLPK